MDSPTREMVFDRRIGKLRALNPSPKRSSANLGWRGYLMETHSLGSFENLDVMWTSHVVILQLNGQITLEFKEQSRFTTRQIVPGQFSIRPAQLCTSARTRQTTEFLTLSIAPTFMAMACGKSDDASKFELSTQTGIADRFVEGVCLALQDEVVNGGKSGRLYSDSLANSLAIHLARKYAVRDLRIDQQSDFVATRNVRQAIEFIQEHLHDELTLHEIAAAVDLSPFHFARLFKKVTGYSPYQFVLKQRVEHAKQLLMRGQPLAKVAVDAGFFDQSHFTAHFKRFCGVTPKQFAAHFNGK